MTHDELVRMRDALVHRGPDDAGVWISPGIALGARRLAILDLSSRGHMPMQTEDGRYTIVYNGEVYNFRSVRADLELRGHRFRSDCDTEVVLRAFVEFGPAMLQRFNGMFAIAIWDSIDRSLFLARDRLGVKPLYYDERDGVLSFASEAKALFAAGTPLAMASDTWSELMCFRYVAGEATPFEGVRRLLPGHFAWWRNGQLQTHRWWRLADHTHLSKGGRTDALQWFTESFDSSVELRKISDVPLGVLLSGGLDSSSIAASMASHGTRDLSTFTVRFDRMGHDEGPIAQQVVERYGLNPHELTVENDALFATLVDAAYFNDEPMVHGNEAHILAISRHAKQHVTVLLSGEGADETLGGYVRYQPLRLARLLRMLMSAPTSLKSMNLTGRWNKLQRFARLGDVRNFVLYNTCNVLPEDLARLGMHESGRHTYRERVMDEAQQAYPDAPFRQAMYYDQHTFLQSLLDRNDRMTMGASIECRVPFLDYRLVEGVAALPTSLLASGVRTKALVRRAIGSRLPDAVLRHKKWGFAAPWYHYLRKVSALSQVVSDLPDSELVRSGPFERSAVRRTVTEYQAGNDEHGAIVMQLVMLAIWRTSFWERVSNLRRPVTATARADS